MKIYISYESKYSVSLKNEDGTTCFTSMEGLKEENKAHTEFLSSNKTHKENMRELNKRYPNLRYQDIQKNTVYGILCRLIGDVRRIEVIKQDPDYILNKIEHAISFVDDVKVYQNEMVRLATPAKSMQNSSDGVIKEDCIWLKESKFIREFLSPLTIDEDNATQYINSLYNKTIDFSQYQYKGDLTVTDFKRELLRAEKIFTEKTTPEIIALIKGCFQKVNVKNLFGILLYEVLELMNQRSHYIEEIPLVLNKNNNIVGFASSNGWFTIREFNLNFVDQRKQSFYSPYSVPLKYDMIAPDSKGKGQQTINANSNVGVTKETGQLIINLDVDQDTGENIKKLIKDAQVATFHLGKKGLAFIERIEI